MALALTLDARHSAQIDDTGSVIDTMVDTAIGGVAPRAVTVGELALKVDGRVEGDREALVVGASSIEDAQAGDIVFAENARHLNQAIKSRASAIVAFLDAVTPDKPLIRVENPRFAFIKILELFHPQLDAAPGIHPTAVLGSNVQLGRDVSIGANATVGDNVTLGDRTAVMPGCFVGDECVLGPDCILHPNVTLYRGCNLGARVIAHAGTVIGADGFGYMQVGGRSYKVPQIGTVEIGDDVEIGANCTIDRAKTGNTVIGERTKIDNLVHIAHNVKLGPDCVIVAQVGIAGSSTLGRAVILAGQVGVNMHVEIGDCARVLGKSSVFGNVKPGETVSGHPARPHMDTQRSLVEMGKLPETAKRVRALEKANSALQEENTRLWARMDALARYLGLETAALNAAESPTEDA
jgi:UDP-3-O-[3-hydroxymyristoyl] glucosamine N-acyltransferase